MCTLGTKAPASERFLSKPSTPLKVFLHNNSKASISSNKACALSRMLAGMSAQTLCFKLICNAGVTKLNLDKIRLAMACWFFNKTAGSVGLSARGGR